MKKVIVVFIFILFLTNVLFAENKIGLNKEQYIKLCGVWDLRKGVGSRTRFSWGKANAVINGSIVIDLGDDNPFILAGPMGRSDIVNRQKKVQTF